jgi:hypothetical protein
MSWDNAFEISIVLLMIRAIMIFGKCIFMIGTVGRNSTLTFHFFHEVKLDLPEAWHNTLNAVFLIGYIAGSNFV